MAMVSNRGRNDDEMQVDLQNKKWKERETPITIRSPHNKLNNNNNNNPKNEKSNYKQVNVPVVYYISRHGQLEHPHFMEVPLSSPHGLFLRDVINRLNLLRGKGMGSQYSWSSKRSYKNGYVWYDLEENDFIYPVHGGEYVLKGSEILLEAISVSKSSDTASSSSTGKNETTTAKISPEFPGVRSRRRNQSWGAIDDLHEYKVYKAESTCEFNGKAAAADASTQTDDKRRRKRDGTVVEQKVEQSREEIIEISPPPSDSSPETLESLMKVDGRLILQASSTENNSDGVNNNNDDDQNNNRTAGHCPSGRMKASSVIMSLISCGSISFRDCGATAIKDHGFSLISQYKTRKPRGENQTGEGMIMMGSSSIGKNIGVEEKEYFSGSLIDSKKKDEFPALKRSSSFTANR